MGRIFVLALVWSYNPTSDNEMHCTLCLKGGCCYVMVFDNYSHIRWELNLQTEDGCAGNILMIFC